MSSEGLLEPLADGFGVVDGALESTVGYGIVPIAASLAVLGGVIYGLRLSYNKIIGNE